MKKILLSVAVGSAIGLTGCLSDGDSAPVSQEEARTPYVRVAFDPAAGVIPQPTDIAFSGTTDGTLSTESADDSGEIDYTDAVNAIGGLDGWSTTQPINFTFNYPSDERGEIVRIDAASVSQEGGVRIFAASNCDAITINLELGECTVAEELAFDTHFTASYTNDNGLTIIPLQPLAPKTTYIVTLTDNIVDELGRAIRPSQTYAVLRNPDSAFDEDDPASGLKRLVSTYEEALDSHGLAPSNYAFASAFTTQSVDDALQTVRLLMLDPTSGYEVGSMQGSLAAPGTLPAAEAQGVQVFDGTVTVPYFSSVSDPLEGRWQAEYLTPLAILGAVQAGAVEFETLVPLMRDAASADPSNPTSLARQIRFEDAAAIEALQPLLALDGARHLTKFNPIPQQQSAQEINFVMTAPAGASPDPSAPLPVVIFQHGITGSKENLQGIAGSLAQAGFVAIAIDHPLHGGRGFGPINASAQYIDAEGDPAEGNPTAYLNLGSLLTARDNLRQSTSDLLALRFALNSANGEIDGAPFINPTQVYFVGHSLGAIAGTNFLAVANSGIPEDIQAAIDQQFGALVGEGFNPFGVQAATLGMPGGGIAPFLVQSESFGPLIRNILSEESGGLEGAALDALIAQFQFAAQTVIESGDPINYGAHLQANETPVLMIQATGDSTIPNQVFLDSAGQVANPTSGTQPLARVMGLPMVTGPEESDNGALSGFVSYRNAGHASLLDPSFDQSSTVDMQTAIATFFATGATRINVTEDLVEQE